MKKGDLQVGVEYAVTPNVMKVPEGGIAAMDDKGYGSGTFPMYASRCRIEEVDALVEVKSGPRYHVRTEKKKMIRVTWLPNLRNEIALPNNRGVYYRDKNYLLSGAFIFAPWVEYVRVCAEMAERQRQAKELADGDTAKVAAAVERLRDVGFTEEEAYSNQGRLIIRAGACPRLVELLEID